MTIREAIEAVDRLTPNQDENIDKVRWLSELDGVVYLEIEKTHGSGNPVCEPWVRTRDPLDREWCGCVPQEKPSEQTFEGYPETVDLDTKLRIPWPYDEIYRWYLSMKICDANGETKKYSNEAAKYNSYWQGYFNAYNQAHMPKQYATHFRL